MFRNLCLLALCLTVCTANQKLVLFNTLDSSDFSIEGYVPDLSNFGFNDVTTTACVVNGIWLLYSNADYNTNSLTGNGVHFIYGENVCSGSTYLQGEITSVRFAGSLTNWKASSINLYGKNWYQGREQFLVTDAYAVLLSNVKSVIVTGNLPWILFDQEDYQGAGVCVKPYNAAYFQPGMYPEFSGDVKSAKISSDAECALYPQA